MSWLYRREGMKLLSYERKIAARSVRSFFVTEAEVALFTSLAPECAVRVDAVCNGVDADYFSPDNAHPTPFSENKIPIVFTGAMDYLPNIDAVRWFVADMLPSLCSRQPQLHFYIVGRSPSPAVLALANTNVTVTGSVPDVRPYIHHAAVVVAPLRIARGIQNKILEAMAMAKPVVASTECASAIDAVIGQELVTANSPSDFIDGIETLLQDQARRSSIGVAARQRVLSDYSWDAHLSRIDQYLPFSTESSQ
jgi:sugar transferase (PEP-CTERM/EpsH1 system associated)